MSTYIVSVTVDKGGKYKPQTRHTTHRNTQEVALIVSTVVLCAGFAEPDANLIAADAREHMEMKTCVGWHWRNSDYVVSIDKVAA